MRIAEAKIDGFGVWNGLVLDELSDRANVVFGPNESGKTTLLEFVRSVLYGFSPSRRRRYLPPVAGGEGGGVLVAVDRDQRCEIGRYDTPGENGTTGSLRIIAADGTLLDERQLNLLLGGVDEATFNNVFAIGLGELQELATLNDSEAAALLYRLTTGLDRVSIVDVLGDLRASRERLLTADGQSGQITKLLARRAKLQSEIEPLRSLTEQYSTVALHQQRLDQDIRAAEAQADAAERQARVIDVAAALGDTWPRRAALEQRLADFQNLTTIPDDALARLEELRRQIDIRDQRLARLRAQRAEVKRQAAALKVNQSLWRQSPRIAALGHQQQWVSVLETEVAQSATEVNAMEQQLAAQRHRLGLGDGDRSISAAGLTRKSIKALKPRARELRETQARWSEARRKQEHARRTAAQLQAEIRAALADRAETDLTAALQTAGNAVSQLRRVIQLDGRIESLTEQREELQDRSRQSLDGQMLPGWVLVALGAVFVCGVMLLLSGLLLPAAITGSVGWLLAVLGLGGAVGTVGVKFSLERAATRRLDATAKQLELAVSQLEQSTQERDAAAATIPRGGGPLGVRLQAAEAELAALEELTGLEGRRQIAETEAQAAAGQLRVAKDERRQARRGWRRALRKMGIDAHLSPRQIGRLQSNRSELDELERRLSSRREEHDARRRQLDALRQSAEELAAEAGITLDGQTAADRIAALQLALEEQEAIFSSRGLLRRRWRKLRRREAKLSRSLTQARQSRRQLLSRHGAADDQELHRLVEACRQRLALINERDELDRRVEAAAAGKCTTQEIIDLLSAARSENLEPRREQLLAAVSTAREELKQLYQRRGECQQQLAALAADRRLPVKLLELGAVEQQLNTASRRWLVLAVTAQVLDEVRALYERQRQPETLQQASMHLEQLTEGHYTRVWTPLDEDVLLVDDAAGRPLSVELLSRGTREQVFLALRLALVATYARRGVRLPLVLDDVLVNFDADRARAAAAVLRDFAAAGHQVLLFTCHEHIMKLFKSLKVPVVRLPMHGAAVAVGFEEELEAATEIVKTAAAEESVDEYDAGEYDAGEYDEDEYEDEVDEEDEYGEYELEEFTETEDDEEGEDEEQWEDEEDDEATAAEDESEREVSEVESDAEDVADEEYDADETDHQFDVDGLDDEFDRDDETTKGDLSTESADRDKRFTWEDRTHLEATAADDQRRRPDAEAA